MYLVILVHSRATSDYFHCVEEQHCWLYTLLLSITLFHLEVIIVLFVSLEIVRLIASNE